MLWHHNARVNSHQRWKQTRFRVCFHLWCELTSTMNVTEWKVSWNSRVCQTVCHTLKLPVGPTSWRFPQDKSNSAIIGLLSSGTLHRQSMLISFSSFKHWGPQGVLCCDAMCSTCRQHGHFKCWWTCLTVNSLTLNLEVRCDPRRTIHILRITSRWISKATSCQF